MSIETGMYLYPWEIADEGEFYRDYAETGCNAAAAALSYHHGTVFSARTGRFGVIPDAAACFFPEAGRYGRLKPEIMRETAQKGTVKALRDWFSRTGRHFSAWIVLLHNSTLGSRHPDLCTENCFGDRYTFSLCPSRAETREYAAAITGDIVNQFAPDSLLFESAAMRAVGHGLHHEISNVRLTAALRWLLSLCFCKDCMAYAAEKNPGLDPEALRRRARELSLALANSETLIGANGEYEDAQLALLLTENPELALYQKARQEIAAGFIGGLSRQARAAKTEFRLIPAAAFNINRLYMEGFSLSAAAGLADKLIPLVYGQGETYSLVRNTIRLFDPHTPVGMGATLHPDRYPGKAAFLGAMAEAANEGCETFYLYNFSIASSARLEWVKALTRQELPA